MCPATDLHAGLRSTICATVVSSSPVTLQHQGPDISRLDAVLQEQWDHDKNRHLGNIKIKPCSNRKCSWVCPLGTPDDPHCWEAMVARRSEVARCPYCIGRKTSKANSLAVVAPETAKAWDYSKNELTPADYTSQSSYKAHWKCPKCCFEWQAKIQTRVHIKSNCPQCSKTAKAQRHPTFGECDHALLAQWDHKANAPLGILPQNTRLRSRKKVNWVCKCCPLGLPHKWIDQPANRTNLSTGCPCCSGHAVCKCNRTCCVQMQTVAPVVAAEWDYARNEGSPADYSAFSNRQAWWLNSRKGSFRQMIRDRTTLALTAKQRQK